MYHPLAPSTIERISRAQGITRPSTLQEKIQIHTNAIARLEAVDFAGKAESLAAHRAELDLLLKERVTTEMLLEEQKAEQIASDNRETIQKVRHGLRAIAYYEDSYPADAATARLLEIIAAARQKGTLA
jgi:hypothetical protein